MKPKRCSFTEDELLWKSIRTARCELEAAKSTFNELTDEKAVDYAAYNLLAAQAKYSYLLSLAKGKRISI